MEHHPAAHAAHAAAEQSAGWTDFFSQQWFMPHGHCYLWKPSLLWLHAGSDTLIGLAYVGISLILWYLVKRVRLPFSPMIIAFGLFIGACGMTHFMEVWNVWHPDYWVAGLVKLITAVASVATAAFLIPMRVRVEEVANSAQLAEQRRIELESKNAELERLYEQVKEMDLARTRFFANVSHELRTPLTLVLGPLERQLADPATDARTRAALETVQRNAFILLRQVNTLLDAARLEAGQTTVETAPMNLAALTRATSASFETFARDRRIHFDVRTPEALWVVADEEKLQRVLLNLLSNAFKFVPESGAVRVQLESATEGVRLQIADSGPGIPPEWRTRVFERFRQVDSGDARRQGGTGLGLAICRDLVELHKGSIQISDAELGGAQVEVLMPLPPAQPGAPAEGKAPVDARPFVADVAAALVDERADEAVSAQGEKPRVLVVEDNPDMRAFLRDTLRTDFEVHLARDGREGLVKAEALRPDVMVTDLMMPSMTGEELMTELRARPELDGVNVVFLTARSEETVRVALLEKGAQDFLAKPFSSQELRARVGNLARSARARAVLQRAMASSSTEIDQLALRLEQRTRELELALDAARAAREEAERSSEVKSTFLSLISHELRTPLTSIQLNAEAAERVVAHDEKAAAAVQRIRQAAKRLFSMVDAVLEFTRIEGGRLSLSQGYVDLQAVAREVTDELLHDAQRKLVRLTLVAPERKVEAHTDARLVRLMLSNLVNNAVKFTEQGEVRVSVRDEPDAQVLEVKDSGPGIPDVHRDRIFEPFVQLSEVQHKSTPGVGLGLALVRRMADAIGAKIEVESTPGQGSTFRVRLPRRH